MSSPSDLILGINPGGGGNHLFIADVSTGDIITQDKRGIPDLSPDVWQQFRPRFDDLQVWLAGLSSTVDLNRLAVVVCRGPALKKDIEGLPDRFGIYSVNPYVIAAVEAGYLETRHGSEHAVLMGHEIAKRYGIDAIFANPISGAMLPERFRITGHPNIAERRPLGHWLSAEGAMLKAFGSEWTRRNIILIHVGTGFTIAAFANGKLVNVNDANAGGSGFSDTRGQGMPFEQSVDYIIGCLMAMQGSRTSRRFSEIGRDIKAFHQSGCGLKGLLGISNLEKLFPLLDDGDERARVVYKAMIEGLAEEITARLVNLRFDCDGIVITGGMANSKRFVDDVQATIEAIVSKVRWHIIPGSCEIDVMISAAQRYLQGEQPLEYLGIPELA